jgi:hypothetical protein
MKVFDLEGGHKVVCDWNKTRYGFRHTAKLVDIHGNEVAKTKACYYNRTWESYEYQSVLHEVIRKHFDEATAKKYCDKVDGKGKDDALEPFRATSMIAKLGDLLCETTEDKNRWKKRMLKAGIPEIDFPSDWEDIPEGEKERRLDAILKQAGGV